VLIDREARDLSVFRANGVERVYDIENWFPDEIPGMNWKNWWLTGIMHMPDAMKSLQDDLRRT